MCPDQHPRSRDATPDLTDKQAAVLALVARLEADLPPADERTPAQHATWLLAQLLDWHRREDKSIWWRFFEMIAMTDEELLADREPIAGVTYEGVVEQVKQSYVHRYRFPPQENAIRDGSEVVEPVTGRKVGTVRAIDQVEGAVDIPRGIRSEPILATALIPHEYIRAEAQRVALMSLGTWVAEHGIDADGPWRAARDLLLRPRRSRWSGTRRVAARPR